MMFNNTLINLNHTVIINMTSNKALMNMTMNKYMHRANNGSHS